MPVWRSHLGSFAFKSEQLLSFAVPSFSRDHFRKTAAKNWKYLPQVGLCVHLSFACFHGFRDSWRCTTVFHDRCRRWPDVDVFVIDSFIRRIPKKKKNILKMSRVQRHLNELKSWFFEGDIGADASSGPNSWTRRPDFDVFTLLLPLILPLYFVSSAFTTRRPHNDDRVPLRSRNDGRRRFSASKTDRLRFALRRSLRPWRQNPGTLRSVVFLPFQLLAAQTKFKQNSFHIKWQTQRVLAL